MRVCVANRLTIKLQTFKSYAITSNVFFGFEKFFERKFVIFVGVQFTHYLPRILFVSFPQSFPNPGSHFLFIYFSIFVPIHDFKK